MFLVLFYYLCFVSDICSFMIYLLNCKNAFGWSCPSLFQLVSTYSLSHNTIQSSKISRATVPVYTLRTRYFLILFRMELMISCVVNLGIKFK